jgi:hypothetical protein
MIHFVFLVAPTGPMFIHTTNASSLFGPSNVFFLAIVLFTKVSNVSTSLIVLVRHPVGNPKRKV